MRYNGWHLVSSNVADGRNGSPKQRPAGKGSFVMKPGTLSGLAGLLMFAAGAIPAQAAGVSLVPPNQTVAQIPVTQFRSGVPATLPATGGHPAVGGVFAIQSYSSRQQVPVSPKPGIQVCLDSGVCQSAVGCVNDAVWPSVAQSIAWWQRQNQAIKGSYAYTVGSTYSHQDARGWIDDCRVVPKPSCQSGAGHWGGYSWNGGSQRWVGGCYYLPRPNCPSGDVNDYTWNWGSHQWTGGCHSSVYGIIKNSGTWHGGHAGTGGRYVVYYYGVTRSEYACTASIQVPPHRECSQGARASWCGIVAGHPLYQTRTTLPARDVDHPWMRAGMPMLANAPYPASSCGAPLDSGY